MIRREAIQSQGSMLFELARQTGSLDKVADESVGTTVEDLLPFLEKVGHPAPTMDPLM